MSISKALEILRYMERTVKIGDNIDPMMWKDDYVKAAIKELESNDPICPICHKINSSHLGLNKHDIGICGPSIEDRVKDLEDWQAKQLTICPQCAGAKYVWIMENGKQTKRTCATCF